MRNGLIDPLGWSSPAEVDKRSPGFEIKYWRDFD
jgi:hypothetical protein